MARFYDIKSIGLLFVNFSYSKLMIYRHFSFFAIWLNCLVISVLLNGILIGIIVRLTA